MKNRLSRAQLDNEIATLPEDLITSEQRRQLLLIVPLLDSVDHHALVGSIYDNVFAGKDQTAANLALNRLVVDVNKAFVAQGKPLVLTQGGAKKLGRKRLLFVEGEADVPRPDNTSLLTALNRVGNNLQENFSELPTPRATLLLTATDIETRALIDTFGRSENRTIKLGETSFLDFGLYGTERLLHVQSEAGSYGVAGSHTTLDQAIRDFNGNDSSGLEAVIAVGVAFGIPNKSATRKLGDVLVSKQLCSYELARVNADSSVTPRGGTTDASSTWLQRLRQTNNTMQPAFDVHFGQLLSGEKLVDNLEFRQTLEAQFPEAIGGEMEGIGVYAAAHRHKLDWIIVKAICDWGDGNKNVATKDDDQRNAAKNAAAFIAATIDPHQVRNQATSLERATAKSKARLKELDKFNQQSPEENNAYPHNLQDIKKSDKAVGSTNSVNALAHLKAWLDRPDASKLFVVLGEYGMGKTVTCQRLYADLSQALTPTARQPFYFDFRELTGLKNGVPTLNNILKECTERTWSNIVDPSLLLQAAKSQRGAVFIFDGLDEVLVHYSEADGQAFTNELMKVLPNAAEAYKVSNSRIIISCRSHLFKDARSERATFDGQDRQLRNKDSFECMTMLPFADWQIRSFLQKSMNVSDDVLNEFMAIIHGVHDLNDVAQRPYTLSLLAELLPWIRDLLTSQAKITGVTVYREVVKRWLERDKGKHQLVTEDKLSLAADLAALLWRSGQRSLPAKVLEDRLFEWLDSEPARRRRYQNHPTEQLAEDLRNSSFLVRLDDGQASSFRFAHTSMQEYFLAEYLYSAARRDAVQEWVMPKVSQETLRFFGQLIEEASGGVEAGNVIRNLTAWGQRYAAQASELRLAYGLFAIENGLPRIDFRKSQLNGAKLAGQVFGGKKVSIDLSGANFEGAHLKQCEFHGVNLQCADFRQSDLTLAILTGCNLGETDFRGANTSAMIVRGSKRGAGVYDVPTPNQWNRSTIDGDKFQNQIFLPKMLRRITSASNLLNSTTVSADGSRIVSGGEDGKLRLWDASTYTLLHTFEGHSGGVMSCNFSADGGRIVSGGRNGKLQLWDASSYALQHTFEAHSGGVWSCNFSADGGRIVSGGRDGKLLLWDASTYALMHTFEGHSDGVRSCNFSADGARIVSGGDDRKLLLWDASTYALLHTFEGHSDWVRSCNFSADGARILSCGDDGKLLLWDASAYVLLHTFEWHLSGVSSCNFSADGGRIVSGGRDGKILLWDASTYALMHTFEGHSRSVRSCNFSADGARIVSFGDDRKLQLWDARSYALLHTFEGHSGGIWSCNFSSDGRRIVSGGSDGRLQLWDASSYALLHTFEGHSGGTWSCNFSADGRRIVSSGGDGKLQLWDASSYALLHTFEGHSDWVRSCNFSADGGRIVSGGGNGKLQLWDASSYALLHTFEGHSGGTWSCNFSADGERIVSGGDDGKLRLWEASTYALLHTFKGHSDWVMSCNFSADGERIVSGGGDGRVQLWDASSYALLHTFEGHSGGVWSCNFSADGERIVSSGGDGKLQLWDASSYALLHTFEVHLDWVRSCNFSADGERIVSGGIDGNVKIHEVSTFTSRIRMEYCSLPNFNAYVSVSRTGSNDEVLNWGGDAWRFFQWQVDKSELPPALISPGKELKEVIPFDLIAGVPAPTC
jgi:WD40 repeat protein/nucleoside phosphorylase